MQDSLTPYLTAGPLGRPHIANTAVAIARPERLALVCSDDAATRRKDLDAAIAAIDDLLIL
jgi:hypothetical protein